jgi:hypothetical protein
MLFPIAIFSHGPSSRGVLQFFDRKMLVVGRKSVIYP